MRHFRIPSASTGIAEGCGSTLWGNGPIRRRLGGAGATASSSPTAKAARSAKRRFKHGGEAVQLLGIDAVDGKPRSISVSTRGAGRTGRLADGGKRRRRARPTRIWRDRVSLAGANRIIDATVTSATAAGQRIALI